ncbi:NAD-dependent epimerase/dehydratase family protein [bacterium]|nr:NAD-dependent epimerase/dehydratase family protein [bacterium]
MKILITGGAGFLGSYLVSVLSKRNNDIIVFDNLSTGKEKNIEIFNSELIVDTIENYSALKSAMKNVDIVFHLAAVTSVVETEQYPQKAFDINTLGTYNVVKSAIENRVKKVIFFSSAAVYGDNQNVPLSEKSVANPKSIYGLTKLDGEFLIRNYAENSGLKYVIMRTFNAYGPRQRLDSQYSAAIPSFIISAANNRPITIYGDGNQTRDFIYAADVAECAVFFAENANAAGIYNLGSGSEISILDIAENIVRIASPDKQIPIKFDSPRPGDIYRSVADVSKLQELGFSKKNCLVDGLKKTIEYFMSRNIYRTGKTISNGRGL